MFNVNLLNEPGYQTENSKNNTIVHTLDSKQNDIQDNDIKISKMDSKTYSKSTQSNRKLLNIVFIIMIVIISGIVLVSYYLKLL